jgi:hypothetical protein
MLKGFWMWKILGDLGAIPRGSVFYNIGAFFAQDDKLRVV